MVAAAARPLVTFIIQYFMHPLQLDAIVARLQHPRVEVLVHADSNTTEDRAALSAAMARYPALLRVLWSANLHEVRGYNKAAAAARGELLVFSQDDRLPPPSTTSWIDAVTGIFDLMGPHFAMLGLHRGCTAMIGKPRRPIPLGSCGDALDNPRSRGKSSTVAGWLRLSTQTASAPLTFVPWLNLGPLVIRRHTFASLGGFNESYSREGQAAIGYDAELTARVWASGMQAALACPSRLTAFRNGCGGKATLSTPTKSALRSRAQKVNEALYHRQFLAVHHVIERSASEAQTAMQGDVQKMGALRALLPGCIDCNAANDVDASLGFAEADASCAKDKTLPAAEADVKPQAPSFPTRPWALWLPPVSRVQACPAPRLR
jgi:hypothetical protein